MGRSFRSVYCFMSAKIIRIKSHLKKYPTAFKSASGLARPPISSPPPRYYYHAFIFMIRPAAPAGITAANFKVYRCKAG